MAYILVADDDGDIRELVEFTLIRAGHTVVTAHDGIDAWAAIRHQPFDLIVLDSMMPGLSGVQVTSLTRGSEDHFALKIIMLSARAREDQIQEGYDAGVDLYITKPFSPREFIEQVTALTG
ncbi:hypothetical protein GCM10023350_08740 [Nocardioides endophyticus]|uniref:Response regulatory domain-containing protein n=1 Tax=Nocardioides endophyticus TaxID=1353775 RepID=A0ABP8YI31_9ACTN